MRQKSRISRDVIQVLTVGLVYAALAGCGGGTGGTSSTTTPATPTVAGGESSPAQPSETTAGSGGTSTGSTTTTTTTTTETPASLPPPPPPAPPPPPPPPPSPIQAGLSEEMKKFLNDRCNGVKPVPQTYGYTVNGQINSYTEVMVPGDDEGGTISAGSRFFGRNPKRSLFVEPASDGKVSWAVRKWVLDQTEAAANDKLKNISVAPELVEEEAKVVVSHPSDEPVPGVRYEVCLVLRVPAEWPISLEGSSTSITSFAHFGPVTALTVTGSIHVEQAGAGTVSVTSSTGEVFVEADSATKVTAVSTTGHILLTMLNGGSPLKYDWYASSNTGYLDAAVKKGLGFHLDASTNAGGSILVPETYPVPSNSYTGQSLAADINGGGAVLKLRAGTGNITVSEFE